MTRETVTQVKNDAGELKRIGMEQFRSNYELVKGKCDLCNKVGDVYVPKGTTEKDSCTPLCVECFNSDLDSSYEEYCSNGTIEVSREVIVWFGNKLKLDKGETIEELLGKLRDGTMIFEGLDLVKITEGTKVLVEEDY